MRRFIFIATIFTSIVGCSGDAFLSIPSPDDASADSAAQDGSRTTSDGGTIDSGGCPSDQALCGTSCKSVMTDTRNCGACGNVCGDGKPPLTGGGTWVCDVGKCAVHCDGTKSACESGCVDTQSDQQNCGSCGNACTGGTTCCAGGCADTSKDNANCGSCGSKCAGTCNAGSCCMTPTKGSCSHDLCSSGASLGSSCDGSQGCVAKVCASDLYCCDGMWDSTCVSEVEKYCSPLKCGC
jgi:hypothetical protein